MSGPPTGGTPASPAYPPAGAPQPPPGGYPVHPGSDPNRPGSYAWVDQRYGRPTTFGERVLPYLIDYAISMAGLALPLVAAVPLLLAGLPDSEPCYPGSASRCSADGTGNGALIAGAVVLFIVSVLMPTAIWIWNRVWRVTRTGQSIGRKVTGLTVINSATGQHPRFGEMFLRELIVWLGGIIDAIWMVIDDDRRTIGDIVATTAVIAERRDRAAPNDRP